MIGFERAYSTTPYTIGANVTSPGPYGTLILTHRARLANRYDATTVQVSFNQLNTLSAHPSVAGLLLDVAGDPDFRPDIRAAYAAWDADLRSPARANDVAAALKGLVREKLQQYSTIRYLVIVGDDAIIPFYVPPDLATVNYHANHFSLGAPAGGGLTASDIVNASASLRGLILYTLGCQAGLNVLPDNMWPAPSPPAGLFTA